ncbi:MAG: ATP-binding protein [Hydrogenophaga sp.]
MARPRSRKRTTFHRLFEASAPTQETEPIVRLWLLRMLVPMGGHHQLIGSRGFSSDALAQALGMGDWIDADEDGEGLDILAILAELRRLHRQQEAQASTLAVPAQLQRNVARLAALVGLSDIDCRILEFTVMLNMEEVLEETTCEFGELSSVKLAHMLSKILALPEDGIRGALVSDGTLLRSGLVKLDHRSSFNLHSKLELPDRTFADRMALADTDPIHLLRGRVNVAPPGHLGLNDYGHIQPTLDILHPYLRQAADNGRRGVNMLLHGTPGTGKSQLARALAADLGCELFEIASEDEDGDPIDGEGRLRALRTAQAFFAQRRALIVFEEAEDVFDDGGHFFGRKSTAQTHKAWLNRALEDNPVPALWLTNSIRHIDPAFVRRFDLVVEMPIPPRQQRQRILEQACGDLVAAPHVARLAEVETLAPAVVTRAAAVVRAIGDQFDPPQRADALNTVIDSTLQAQGHAGLRRHDPNRLPELYDPAFIQADADLAQVAEGLRHSRSGRLCLYGPPGTGKTAYARWLAQQMNAPLLVRRASDLLSMWVGGTEQNMARAFRDAEREKAVLLIDEVDSFLQDRRGASKSWEVTAVNEMLTQMESFAGVFVASTNLMDGLDPAALRRFDLKVKFDFLAPGQATELLRRQCAQLGLDAPDAATEQAIGALRKLTPGDFAAVLRQHRFHPVASAAQWVRSLQAECALKQGPGTPIGFVL